MTHHALFAIIDKFYNLEIISVSIREWNVVRECG